jgi:predicted permease
MLWRNFLQRDRADQEWREEMEAHLRMLIDSFLEQGMTLEKARHAALKQAGNLTARREEIYRMNGIPWFDSISGDVRYAARGLRKTPSFTAVAVLTLALGIGANTTVFSVVNSVLLQPLAFPRAEELVDVAQVAPGAGGIITSRGGLGLSPSMYFTYTEQNRSFQSMGVWTSSYVTVTGLAEPEQVSANFISDGMLPALAVEPEIGRWFVPAEQLPGSNELVLLTYGYWQRRFGGDRSVIGRKIFVDASPREIIGVMPAGFRIADTTADLILPLRLDRSRAILAGFYLRAIGRMKPGVSVEQANADIARLIPIWMRSWPSIERGHTGDALAEKVYRSWRIGPNVRPLRDSVVGNVRSVLWVVMGTLGMVMLIACANVANLLLVRVDARQSDLAVRAALGAGWGRIVRQLLIESLLLGAVGGTLGLAIAYGGLRLLVRNGPSNLPRFSEIGLDSHALIFTFVVTLVSGLVFGLIPALRYAGPHVSLALRDGGRTTSPGRSRQRARNTLVIVQVSLALVLLISSGLMIRTFQATQSVRLGFERPAALQTFRVVIPQELVPKDEEAARMEQAIAEKVAALPGVSAAGLASALPMDGAPPNWDGILTEGQSYAKNRPPMRLYLNVSPGLFSSLGSKIKAGRDLSWTDIYGDRKFVLVSENLARELWGSAQAARYRQTSTRYRERSLARSGRCGRGCAPQRRSRAGSGGRLLAHLWTGTLRADYGCNPVCSVLGSDGSRGNRHIVERNPSSRAVRECRTGDSESGNDARDSGPLHGAHFVHAGDAGHRRRNGAGAGVHRNLWRDRVRRLSENARDRNPHGAGRRAGRHQESIRPPRVRALLYRDRNRFGRRRTLNARDEIAAVRRAAIGSADLCSRPSHPLGRHVCRVLLACEEGVGRGPSRLHED